MKRQSIYIPTFAHKNPIPAACRFGALVESGSVLGTDPSSGKLATSIEDQCEFMLQNLKAIVEAAGGTAENVVKVTVYMKDPTQRVHLNKPWVEMFPDEMSRPARHVIRNVELDNGRQIECVFTAFIP